MVGVFDHFEDDQYVYIVTKHEAGGDLCGYVDACGKTYLSEEVALNIFAQMAVGLKDIHMNQIAHYDIKHKNIFLSNFSESPKVKIADFGLACHL